MTWRQILPWETPCTGQRSPTMRAGFTPFDVVTANPMWNQKFSTGTYDNDPHNRFAFGAPPASSADWGWVQHMAAHLALTGRMAVVLDAGAASRGSGNQGSNKERNIRRAFYRAGPYRGCPPATGEPVL